MGSWDGERSAEIGELAQEWKDATFFPTRFQVALGNARLAKFYFGGAEPDEAQFREEEACPSATWT